MIKNIIFDCSDTLVHFELTKKTAEWLGGDIERAKKIHTLTYGCDAFKQYCFGYMTYEQAKPFALEALEPCDREIGEKHIEERMLHYRTIDGIPELLQRLKDNGYKLYILSDFPDYFEYLWENFDFFKLFDGKCVSYEAHAGKRDGKLFEVIIDRYSLDPTECVFIDDTVRNAVTSQSFGMKGIAFTSTVDTIEKLIEFGVNI